MDSKRVEYWVGELNNTSIPYPDNLVIVPENWIFFVQVENSTELQHAVKYIDIPFEDEMKQFVSSLIELKHTPPENWQTYLFKPIEKFVSQITAQAYIGEKKLHFAKDGVKENKRKKASPPNIVKKRITQVNKSSVNKSKTSTKNPSVTILAPIDNQFVNFQASDNSVNRLQNITFVCSQPELDLQVSNSIPMSAGGVDASVYNEQLNTDQELEQLNPLSDTPQKETIFTVQQSEQTSEKVTNKLQSASHFSVESHIIDQDVFSLKNIISEALNEFTKRLNVFSENTEKKLKELSSTISVMEKNVANIGVEVNTVKLMLGKALKEKTEIFSLEDFALKYELTLPIDNKHKFDELNFKIGSDSSFKEDLLRCLKDNLDPFVKLQVSLQNLLILFIEKQIYSYYNAQKEPTQKEKEKQISKGENINKEVFKFTEFSKVLQLAVQKRFGDEGSNKNYSSTLSTVFNLIRDGERSKEKINKNKNNSEN